MVRTPSAPSIPTSAITLNNLAELYRKQGRTPGGRAALPRALAI